MNGTRYRWRLLLGGYLLAEVGAAMLVADAIGWGWTLLLLLAGLPVGIALLPRNPVAGILIAMPGFISDAAGLALLVPAVRMRVARASGQWLQARLGFAAGEVVPGVVVEDPPPGAPGEIVQGIVVREGRDEDR